MEIKLYGCLLTLVISAFSHYIGDAEFGAWSYYFDLSFSGKRHLMHFSTPEPKEIRTSCLLVYILFLYEAHEHKDWLIENLSFQEHSVSRVKSKDLS